MDSNDILDWYERARETAPDLQLFFTAGGKDTLFPAEKSAYLDLDGGTASFDSPGFHTFLERTNAVLNDDPGLDPEDEIGYGDAASADELLRYQATGKEPVTFDPQYYPYYYNIITKGRASLAVVDISQTFALTAYDQPFAYMAGPFPLTDTLGRLGLSSTDGFAVPSSCRDPALAWEFIKYCVSGRETVSFEKYGYGNTEYTRNLPINKRNFSLTMEGFPEVLKRGVSLGRGALGPVDGELLAEKVEQALALELIDSRQYGVDVGDYLEEYYEKGLTTAEQCAKKVQDRAEIWLGE